ncbi:hypothetical protein AX289_29225 [Methylorubrum populi]|nr:hypothetical protein AX289_29225 [Methylorubrum populi]
MAARPFGNSGCLQRLGKVVGHLAVLAEDRRAFQLARFIVGHDLNGSRPAIASARFIAPLLVGETC